MATSTLELGIDVSDLDRVIQVNDPPGVSSFLQRIGRTGRRTGNSRNFLFLALTEDSLLSSAGLLHLWGQGYVEPVVAPPEPRHIVAQQLLAPCLQEHRTAPPQFTVLYSRQEAGRTDPMLLTEKIDGPRLLLLGDRSWKVTWTDWTRRRPRGASDLRRFIVN